MKTFSVTPILFVLLLFPVSVRAQAVGEACAMSASAVTSTCQLAGLTLEEPITIPVVVHVVASSSGQGDVSFPVIEDQIDVLNDAFDESGFPEDIRFQFELVGVGRVRNTSWHEMPNNAVNLELPEG